MRWNKLSAFGFFGHKFPSVNHPLEAVDFLNGLKIIISQQKRRHKKSAIIADLPELANNTVHAPGQMIGKLDEALLLTIATAYQPQEKRQEIKQRRESRRIGRSRWVPYI